MSRSLAFTIITGLLINSVLAQDQARLLRFPAIHKDQIVFTYAGDLYSVASSGGVARKLTNHEGFEMFTRFSPDGKHLGYAASRGSRGFIVCDSMEGPAFDELPSGAHFSPDSRHLAYVADRDGKAILVLDGVESAPHDWVNLPEGCADVPGKLRCVVIDNSKARLVEVDWPTTIDWTNGLLKPDDRE